MIEIDKEIINIGPDLLGILHYLGGYYECPRGPNGERLGPVVGYAGKYMAHDGSKKQFVGDIYANCAVLEGYPPALYYLATGQIRERLLLVVPKIDVFCGAPLGGYSFAEMLGLVFNRRAVKAEKKVIAVATADSREQSMLVFGRHQLKKGDKVVVTEDVANNFSTTNKLIELVSQAGAEVIAIACLLNRSPDVNDFYVSRGVVEIAPLPVISFLRKPIPEYRQDDPAVAEDVERGNISWKPKDDWPRLMEAMKSAKK